MDDRQHGLGGGLHHPNSDQQRAPRPDHRFEVVVAPLRGDLAWRRRIRMITIRDRVLRAGSWVLRCLAELGCWFTGVPPQRCGRSAGAR